MRCIVEIVLDKKTNRLRAKPMNKSGLVRFPNRLRKIGAMYLVENLKKGLGKSWIATGSIRTIRSGKRDLKYW